MNTHTHVHHIPTIQHSLSLERTCSLTIPNLWSSACGPLHRNLKVVLPIQYGHLELVHWIDLGPHLRLPVLSASGGRLGLVPRRDMVPVPSGGRAMDDETTEVEGCLEVSGQDPVYVIYYNILYIHMPGEGEHICKAWLW